MVGDWVLTDMMEQMQVCEIHEDEVMLDYNDMYDYADIEPIPLTPEILEKNGFNPVYEDKCVMKYIEIDKGNILLKIVIDMDIPSFSYVESNIMGRRYDGEIKYCHELQHALRLCGINKEIELLND